MERVYTLEPIQLADGVLLTLYRHEEAQPGIALGSVVPIDKAGGGVRDLMEQVTAALGKKALALEKCETEYEEVWIAVADCPCTALPDLSFRSFVMKLVPSANLQI